MGNKMDSDRVRELEKMSDDMDSPGVEDVIEVVEKSERYAQQSEEELKNRNNSDRKVIVGSASE